MLARSALALLLASLPFAVPPRAAAQDPPGPVPEALLDTCDWRLVGPFRGGRVAAVTGVRGDRDTYYFGSVGGGVWKTTDAGKTWACVSDGTFGGSIGAVATAPSDPKVVYVGGGEKTWRGNVSSGDGMWKSTDGGKTWEFAGLPDSRHVSRIRVHPKNADLVYAAVMGHVSGPNEERGVFRSKDGGKTWQRVLFANAQAGAVDLCLQPDEPNTLWATTWRAIRTPWSLESGGEGSGVWKSADGGETWKDLTRSAGLPKGTIGICGVAVSPAKPERVWALIEAEDGGLFRSDDGGASWTRVNEDRSLRQRAWYYTRVFADPKDAETVYVVNVQFHRSTDGGKTFTTIGTPHGDNHDLWIDPDDPARMIEGNDGGACVTNDGGRTWTSLDNQPTAQFYRVTTDDHAPYRIYGAQQDNSTVRIAHRGRGAGIGRGDWESTAGGESGWLAPKPGDSEVVFGGSYGGYLQRLDHRTGLSRNVAVWPDNPMGWGAAELRWRFQWNFPILFSRHDANVLYTAAQSLFRSTDEGQTWTAISPDLTRDDKTKQQASGGPITKDNTSVEYYCTIFAVDESPRRAGVLWCGTDDGRVHVTRDGGAEWKDVTPPTMPEWAQVNQLAAHPFADGGCYVAATRYKLDDFRPYLWVTEDFGASWREITGGLDPKWFARCIRPDPVKRGLLYCGTERTVWVSFDDGRRWQRLQRNLPLVPVTDLCVKDDHLIAATQGRSFWSFDHLAHLRQLGAEQATADAQLYAPGTLVQFPGDDEVVPGSGRNPSRDLVVRFHVGAAAPGTAGAVVRDHANAGEPEPPVAETVVLEIRDFDGKLVHERSTAATDEKKKLTVKRGMNAIACEVTFEAPKVLDGMVLWAGGRGTAPRAGPGEYSVTLKLGERTLETKARIAKDPRTPATEADLQQRHRFVVDACELVTRAHTAIESMRGIRSQMTAVVARASGDAKKELDEKRAAVEAELVKIEEALYQTKSKSSQDPLNYPIRLTDKLLGVLGAVAAAEFGPTAAQNAVRAELGSAIEAQLGAFEKTKTEGVAAFNELALRHRVPYVQ